ncbi:uncharacterized protein LOC126836087 [Adelges cooleyi]|uniref:uncharacterized protein LOC126836087 n=1 Tax=Adelges cooleyi TaxID=133065 RepID=UPI00217F911A|nr:uncharacterized protein LOC126836087 [Adelges cooleyi]XP_050425071.1 uncharacterized protein LOC126836087 [Adelges cooleyi]XP_050425072.1 uncharacterized protein LOC126836087 [Adelges cooleyi]
MHFKSAVILCAVIFFSSARSTGLNRGQIVRCMKLYAKQITQTAIFAANITNIMKNQFGIEYPKHVFEYKPNEPVYVNLKNLFLALAYEDKKISDSFEVVMLTPFEVHYFLNVFISHPKHNNQEGYLTGHQLFYVFEQLQLTEEDKTNAVHKMNELRVSYRIKVDELSAILLQIQPEIKMRKHLKEKTFINDIISRLDNYKQDGYLTYQQLTSVFELLDLEIIQKIQIEKLSGYIFNQADFLFIMIEILPNGSGLTLKQVQEFDKLYRQRLINPREIKKIFIGLNMANESHQELMQFRYNRPADKELMELMIVTAQRSRAVNPKDEAVLSTQEVRSLVSTFTNLNKGQNGILSKAEVKPYVEGFLVDDPEVLTKFQNDGNFANLPPLLRLLAKDVNVAEFLLFHIFKKSIN